MVSLLTKDLATRPTKFLSAKFKLSWELTAMEMLDVSNVATKDVSVDAVTSPTRCNEDH